MVKELACAVLVSNAKNDLSRKKYEKTKARKLKNPEETQKSPPVDPREESSTTVRDGGVYVISTRDQSEKNIYKIGMHHGSHAALLRRYITDLIDPYIFYFKLVEDPKETEKEILLRLSKNRIISDNNHRTKWVQLPIKKIIEAIEDI